LRRAKEQIMTERSDPIVVAASVRTPLGRFQGELSSVPAPRLGSAVIKAAVERAPASIPHGSAKC
jgi:acetyl-CoA C-acetyltransferase